MTDNYDYPSDEVIHRIETWEASGYSGLRDLMAYVREHWWMPEWGWTEYDAKDEWGHPYRVYRISTGGWSGNEDLIHAMRQSRQSLLWMLTWRESRSGGHYEFWIREEDTK